MSRLEGKRRGDLWLPGLVIAIGWSLSFAGWWLVVVDRRRDILDWTADLSEEARTIVAERVESYLGALDDLASLWAELGRVTVAFWQADVEMLRRNFPALASVAWIESDGQTVRLSPRGAPVDRILRFARSGPVTEPTLLGPERGDEGEACLRVLIPVGPRGEGGLLVARIDLEALLSTVFEAASPGHAIRVYWGEDEIFARGRPSTDRWQRWWTAVRDVDLPEGIVWRVVHRPTDELAAARLTPLPHYLLASGLALWLVVAWLAHHIRLRRRQARFLAASNLALEERGEELERRVAERTAALEDAVGELRSFNQTVAHDLRSPLSAVLNFVAILEEDYRGRALDAQGLDLLARVRSSASRANDLLDGLLRLSRAGRARLDLGPVDAARLAREVFAQVCAGEDDTDVELVVEELPEVEADRTLLGDVFSNLFSNALRYSRGREKRRITVRGREGDGRCVFEVSDNGRGFDMRFHEKIFAMFERLDPDDGVGGTGVGLAIVARVTRRLGGRIWAESQLGEGASFFVELPSARGAGP